MRKIISILCIMVFLVPTFYVPNYEVKAKTLGDIKSELQKYEQDYINNKNEQKKTEEEIQQTKQSIVNTNKEIDQIGKDIIALNFEIENLNIEIEKKDKEIKEIMNFIQISSGESAYLEYAFGASDFTDFIYRVAISEQLTNYNNSLIDSYNENIENNQKKTKELDDKKVVLNTKQKDLAKLLTSLEYEEVALQEDSVSIEEEIKLRKEAIDLYENQLGCKDNEDINTCGRNILPPDTAFYRPLASGRVTQEFGYPDDDTQGYYSIHGGLDMSTTDNNTPVYAAASGIVIAVSYNQPCGNNIVYIQHNIKGLGTYTTAYWHMRRALVKAGDRVTKDTQIGIMGGRAGEDSCSLGAHVHFVVATGLYMVDYHTLSQLNARRINPRMVLNVPSKGVYFKDRITKY